MDGMKIGVASRHPPRLTAPVLHHVNYKTTRLQAMLAWYRVVLGAQVLFQNEQSAWLASDRVNHRIALLALPDAGDKPAREHHAGLHHTLFDYGSFDELMETYARLKGAGILPRFCLHRGLTTSLYYFDPDGNGAELQADNIGEWNTPSKAETRHELRESPIGVLFDADRVLAAWQAGMSFQELHRRCLEGAFLPDHRPPFPMPRQGDTAAEAVAVSPG